MQLFFGSVIEGSTVFLDGDEARHCKVLRKQEGDEISVIDGKGLLLRSRILKTGRDKVEAEILESVLQPRTRDYYFHLLIAPTKQNERMEWMLEKAVEIGLDEITFIETEHSEKHRLNIGRLEKIAISAIKQSLQYYLPVINPLTSLKQVGFDENTFIAHCIPEEQKSSLVSACNQIPPHSKISILIGPEGDFSGQEVAYCLDMGARAIQLGANRLRTETAGLYCAAILSGLA